MKRKNNKIQRCSGSYPGCNNIDVKRVICTYTQDIYDTIVWVYLCTHCYKERCNDI